MLAPTAGNKKSEITESQFGDGGQLAVYKEVNGLVKDGYVGKFVSVTFDYKEPETFVGLITNKCDERKVGGVDHWDVYFEDGEEKAIPLSGGDWEWDFLYDDE